jgi:hypothetical protein
MKMAVLQAKKLKAALEKAKKVGLVEEAVTVAGCQIVLRSLTPDEYEAISEEGKDLEELAYLNAFQIGHLARSIVEIDGVDLRDVDFVEVEDEETSKLIKLEKHAWLRDTILRTWSREAIISSWRKLLEVMALSEVKAKEGITFTIAEETDEEKFRRLLAEMLESTADLPPDLVIRILDDGGLILKSTKAELEEAAEKLSDLGTPEEPAVPSEAPEESSERPPVDVDALMRNRTPLNQGVAEVPVPQTVGPISASRKAEVPEAIRQAAVPTQSLSRAAQIAALEGEVLDVPPAAPQAPGAPEAVELKRTTPIDTKEVKTILDKPPVAGINTRYSPPRRA